MTIPLWSLLVGSVFPYLWFGVATRLRKAEFGAVDNNLPRVQEAKQTGAGARAMGAHGNAFEALMVWAPAVLAAQISAPGSTLAPMLAIGWMVARFLHGVVYVADIAPVRSLLFFVGFGCAIAMYLVAGHTL